MKQQNMNAQSFQLQEDSVMFVDEQQIQKNNCINNAQTIYAQSYQYIFPIKLLEYKTVPSRQQFKRLLEQQDYQKAKNWMVNRTRGGKGPYIYIYITCNLCNARMHYTENQDKSWTLGFYNNRHLHKIHHKRARRFLNQLAYIKRTNIASSKHLQLEQYQIRKKEMFKESKFNLIKQLLMHVKFNFRYELNKQDLLKEGYPETLVAVSLQQRQNYLKYGDILRYEINYKCIKQSGFNGKKYGVGIFSGYDRNYRIVIFGFSLISQDTTYSFENIFKCFFDLMGNNFTQVIITEQKPSIIQALSQLKSKNSEYNFCHLLDMQNFLRQFFYSLKGKQKQFKTSTLSKLTKFIKQCDPVMGKIRLKQLKMILQKQKLLNQYKKIQERIPYVCLWGIPVQFIGLHLYLNEKLIDLLDLKVQNEVYLYEFIEKINEITKQKIKISEQSYNLVNYTFQKLFDDHQILEVRKLLGEKIFNSFIYYYQKSGYYQFVNSTKNDQQQSQDIYNTYFYIKNIITNLTYKIKYNDCACQVTIKKGLPCEHLIFLAKQKFRKEGYLHFFHHRWFPIQESNNIEKKEGRKHLKKLHKKLII